MPDLRVEAAGPVYAGARCLVGCDEHGNAVAAVTIWSAGPGRPGLLEPMGVHRVHRARGHGRAITDAAAAALRELGASSAIVCTPSADVGAVATYQAAGFRARPEIRDLRRDAQPRFAVRTLRKRDGSGPCGPMMNSRSRSQDPVRALSDP